MDQSRSVFAFGAVLVAAIIALFCPWADIPLSSAMPSGAFGDAFRSMPMAGTMTVDAFNGHITLVGIKTPNWLLVVLTVLGAGLALLRALTKAPVPGGAVLTLFAVSGIFMVTGMVALLGNAGVSAGIGIPLLLLADVGGIVAWLRLPRATAGTGLR